MSGNHVIFFHPDGGSPSLYSALRALEVGPDNRLNWDRMSNSGTYLGHMQDQLTGTSNGGAVTHATGVKVYAESYGLNADGSRITSLSRQVGKTIVEEAIDAKKFTALINSGFIAEPGTGAFIAEVGAPTTGTFPRQNLAEITRQMIESGADVIMGGGELHMLPAGTTGRYVTAEIDAANDPSKLTGSAAVVARAARPTQNLIELARSKGYTIVYNKDELNALFNANRPGGVPQKVLGVFAAIHTFNDRSEEVLGLNTSNPTPLYLSSAPTVAEMLQATTKILEKHPNFKNGSMIVMEEEGVDNFGNINNAAGMLEAARRKDAAFGVAMDFINRNPNTLLVTAADSDGGGFQFVDVNGVPLTDPVTNVAANPTAAGTGTTSGAVQIPTDGIRGQNTPPFISKPDANGNTFGFRVVWAGQPDFAGAIVAKAHGLNSSKLPETVDNTDIYRLMYETLFPEKGTLPAAPTANTVRQKAPAATKSTGNVIFLHPDGAGHTIWNAARMLLRGADGRLNWDMMSNSGVYDGNLADNLTGSSDGSAVTHAMGVKAWDDSYGFQPDGTTQYTSLSGKVGTTILEEARDAGKTVAIINSGHIAEPGSGAFLASAPNRGDFARITEEIIRAGTDPNARVVILGGGETYMLPRGQNVTNNANARHTTAAIDTAITNTAVRPTTDLIALAKSLGFSVVYTLAELQALPASTRKVLGVFAATNTYDDRREEQLNLNTANPLPLYRSDTGIGNTTPSTAVVPPTIGQMMQQALRFAATNPNGFAMVAEEEGTDNFANANNAPGTLEAARRADEALGVAMDFIQNTDPNTLLLTTADSEAGGLQVYQPTPFARAYNSTEPTAPTIPVNPGATGTTTTQNILDGSTGSTPRTATTGQDWDAFTAAKPILADPQQRAQNFGIAWAGTPDFAGSIHVKAHGMNADKLPQTVDNTEIYRMMYQTLFGKTPEETAGVNPRAYLGNAATARNAIAFPDLLSNFNLKFTLQNRSGAAVNEIGVFAVDNEKGEIRGINGQLLAPGSREYTQAALERSQVLFSSIANNPSNFTSVGKERILTGFDSSDRLSFYLIQDSRSTTASVLDAFSAGNTIPNIAFSAPTGGGNVNYSALDNKTFTVNFGDNNGGFVLKADVTTEQAKIGTALQVSQGRELVDLRDLTGRNVRANITVNREAAFNNFVGLYRVDDINGTIDGLNVGDAGYLDAALGRRRVSEVNLRVNNQATGNFDATIAGGSILAPFIVVDGGVEDGRAGRSQVYFSFLGANPQRRDHVRLLGDNTFGFEDLPSGGDFDYNDMIVKMDLSAIA